jgi:hypothetical protein
MFDKFKMADHFVGMSWFHEAIRGRRMRDGANEFLGDGRDRTAYLIKENLIDAVDAVRESFPSDNPGGNRPG